LAALSSRLPRPFDDAALLPHCYHRPPTPPKAASGFVNAAALVLADWLVDKGVLAADGVTLGTHCTGVRFFGFVRVTIQVSMGRCCCARALAKSLPYSTKWAKSMGPCFTPHAAPTRTPLWPPRPTHVQAGNHGMRPSVYVFASNGRSCGTREAALQLAGLQLLWEAGACPEKLLDDAGRPCREGVGGFKTKPKRKRPLVPRAGGAGSWKRQHADGPDVTSPGPKN
jgi:hypothetical protein